MSNTFYNPFNNNMGWTFGGKMPGYNEWHSYLGPCPKCGFRCFDYGGGWRCLDPDCDNSFTNPTSSLGSRPSWWNTGIHVKKDGNAWCAHHSDFTNLQESVSGWGESPGEAVKNLLNPHHNA